MHAIIHIGAAKTGTTSIQRFLSDNRQLLRDQGVVYPQYLPPWRKPQPRGAVDHNYMCERPLEALCEPFRAECRAGGSSIRLLLSSENLSQLLVARERLEGLHRFIEELGCTDVSIVVWLRETGAMFTSLCSQWLRNGFPEYTHLLPPRAHARFCLIMDYRGLLQRWAEVFGREALVVRLFERECFVQGDLLHDAVDAFGLEWDERFKTPPRVNETLNLLEIEVLRVVNHLIDGPIYFQGTPKHLLAQVISEHLGALDGPQLRFAPPGEIVQAWREWAAEGNEWVRQEFFPDRPTLFAPPREQEENFELTQLTPGCWEALGRVMAELSEENCRLRAQLQQVRAGS